MRSSASAAIVTPSARAGFSMARRAASRSSGPTSGKSNSRSAYDFAEPVRARSCGRPAPTSVTGDRRCAARCSAVMSAASSSSSTYCSSSTNSANAVSASWAAVPADSSSSVRSCSRSPLSASPGSGSTSRLTSMSWYFIFRAVTKPASPRSARCARSRARSCLDSFNSACRSRGARIAGSDRFSGASTKREWMPAASASSRSRSRRTVLPTPRRPTIRTLLAGRASRTRASATLTVSRSPSRPANSGGGVPAPGA